MRKDLLSSRVIIFKFAPAAIRRGTTTLLRLSSGQYMSTRLGPAGFFAPSAQSLPVLTVATTVMEAKLFPCPGWPKNQVIAASGILSCHVQVSRSGVMSAALMRAATTFHCAMLEEMGLNSDQHLERASLGGKTFSTEAGLWREQKLSKYKPSCQETMGGHLDKYLIPQLGSLPMAAIDERRVQELITEMERVEYTRSDGVKKKLSPKSIRNVIGVLKLMIGKKVWRDWNLVFPENIDPDKEQRYFTQAEMIQVVNAADGQWKVLFALMAGSGLRIGEVSGLEIEDLDLEAGLIRVRRGIWKGRAITPKTKRGKRTVFIEPTLVRMLSSYLVGRTSGKVFQTKSGKPHSRHNVWRKLKLILKSLGLQPGGLHAFRHGRISMLQANGMPGDLLLEQVGHSNLKTTSGYTHFDDAFRQRMARVQGLFSQEDGPNGPKFPDSPSTGRLM